VVYLFFLISWKIKMAASDLMAHIQVPSGTHPPAYDLIKINDSILTFHQMSSSSLGIDAEKGKQMRPDES
jgi:hypothetical protein